ncbi:MAG: hypothetical protein J5I93_04835 [Pirellulaceae bacterium]|nr:hypothetical protein [Pirellulaceae bacterium]
MVRVARVLTVGLMLAVCIQVAHAQGGNKNPGVLPPGATYRGMTYGEWGASWWRAAFAIPVVDGDHPLFSGGAFQGEKGVVYLAAVVGAPAVVEVTVPPGTPLFLPVVNAECSVIEPPPFHGDDEEELRACANEFIDFTSGRSASVDGKAVKNLDAYRTESPLFEFGPLPEDNLFGEPAGTTSPAVDAGYYLMLAPLSKGHHVVHVTATFDLFGASIDTYFLITVKPAGR